MLNFNWLRSPWERADIFRYSPSSRKMVALFVNIADQDKNYCNEVLATKSLLQRSHYKLTSFFPYLQLFPARQENSNNLISPWQVLTYLGNKYNNCFFNLFQQQCPRSSQRPRKLGWYLEIGQHFPVQIEKTLITVMLPFKSVPYSILRRLLQNTGKQCRRKID